MNKRGYNFKIPTNATLDTDTSKEVHSMCYFSLIPSVGEYIFKVVKLEGTAFILNLLKCPYLLCSKTQAFSLYLFQCISISEYTVMNEIVTKGVSKLRMTVDK